MVIRPSLTTLVIYAGWSFGASVILVTGAVVLRDPSATGPPPQGAYVAFALLFAIFVLPVAFIRCELRGDGVRVRNYFRSYSFRWSDVAAVELARANPFLTLEASWTWLPRFRLRSDDHVDARGLAHIRKKNARAFADFVAQKASELSFEVDIDPAALSR